MQTAQTLSTKQPTNFPPFDLARLLQTVFHPKKGEKLCILIDLDNPKDVVGYKFLNNPKLTIQKKAYEVFYQGLRQGVMQQLNLATCDFFAYQVTGGSNLELPETLVSPEGKTLSFTKDIYPKYNIILCISTCSATAPLTAAAKTFNFRGATMHGMNDVILSSGLAVDYNIVSRDAEKLRQGMTHADFAEIDFEVEHKKYQLHIDLDRQDAQKSHGLCRQNGDIANLPAGEVYFVPTDAHGQFPIKFEEDSTIGLMHVEHGRVNKVSLINGDQKTVDKYQKKFQEDPATGILGELGFGTQELPYAKADIQDEKIFGTFHVATGRNDHLTGNVTLDRFKEGKNATHEDILFSSTKTPEIRLKQVRLNRQGKTEILIEEYSASPYLRSLLKH